MADAETPGFGVYVHWPFCQAKCPYCDFNSHVRNGVDHAAWADALCSEIRAVGQMSNPGPAQSVFFGGGTPSLMEPETVSRVLDAIDATWGFTDSPEITLEANPTSVELQRFRDFRAAGINRVSVGVQALNSRDLRRLGRLHSSEDALQAFDIAREAFGRTSFDLIYARQDQSLQDWEQELRQALSFDPDHLSLYQLTIEPETVFGRRFARGMLHGLPGEDLSADMYNLTQALCSEAGMPAYEVSNHAKPGFASEHNLIYWRYGQYAGIGPGAHGRLRIGGALCATTSPLLPEEWLSKAQTAGHAVEIAERLDPSDQLAEYLMMSLRLAEGASLARIEAYDPSALSAPRLLGLIDTGHLKKTNSRLVATDAGRIILNSVLSELLMDLD